jgi:hypothetical protein
LPPGQAQVAVPAPVAPSPVQAPELVPAAALGQAEARPWPEPGPVPVAAWAPAAVPPLLEPVPGLARAPEVAQPWLAPEPALVSVSLALALARPSPWPQASSASIFPAPRLRLVPPSHLAVRSETLEAERPPAAKAATRIETPLAAHHTHSHPDSRRTASTTNTPRSPAATGTTMPKLLGGQLAEEILLSSTPPLYPLGSRARASSRRVDRAHLLRVGAEAASTLMMTQPPLAKLPATGFGHLAPPRAWQS